MRVASLTTFGVGGTCERVVRVEDPEALLRTINLFSKNKIKHRLIAGGSNVVWQDAHFSGAVIKYEAPVKKGKNIKVDGLNITCDSSVRLADFITFAMKHNLAGLEALSGIPGTVGGAVVGNAGAYGQGISDTLKSVEVWEGAKIKTLSKAACKFSYRDSIFKHKPWLVLRATFTLKPGERKALEKKSREIIKLREKKYPPGLRCPGSYFKNVLVREVSKTSLKKIDRKKIIHGKIPAGYLLETVGACGLEEGGVRVAPYHGNLLLNQKKGTAKDVKLLAKKLKDKVRRRYGIRLEEEIRYLP